MNILKEVIYLKLFKQRLEHLGWRPPNNDFNVSLLTLLIIGLLYCAALF